MSIKDARKEELRLEVDKKLKEFKESFPGVIEVPMNDSINKIEKLGIFVLISSAPDKVSGFCMIIGEDAFIFINKDHVMGRQNFSLWHEVYHWFTNNTGLVSICNEKKDNEKEFEADYFASLVLIDKAHLKAKLTEIGVENSDSARSINSDDVIKLQHYFQVSYAAVLRKIIEIYPDSDLKRLSDLGSLERQEEFIQKTKGLGFNTDLILPKKNTYISSELFILLKKLAAENKISQNKVLSILNIIEKELD